MKDSLGLQSQNTTKVSGIAPAQVIRVIKHRKNLLVASVVVSCLGAWASGLLHIPTYTATTTIMVKKPEDNQITAVLNLPTASTFSSDGSERLERYVSYLDSGEFFVEVAGTVKFDEEYGRLQFTHPSEMKVTSSVFWEYQLSKLKGDGEVKHVFKREANGVRLEQIAPYIRSVTAARVVGTDSISLSVTTLDPFTSIFLVNTVTDMFVEKIGEREFGELNEVKRFISTQLEKTTATLRDTELEVVEFKRKHSIYSGRAEDSQFTMRARALDQDLAAAQVKHAENIRLVEYYQKLLKDREGALTFSKGSTDIGTEVSGRLELLQSKRALLEARGDSSDAAALAQIDAQMRELSGTLNDPARVASRAEGSVDGIRKRLNAIRTEDRMLEAKLATLDKSRLQLMDGLGELSKNEQFLMAKTRDLDLSYELYGSLKKKLQEVEIQQVAGQSRASILGRAVTAYPKLRPALTLRLAFAILLGLFFGGGVAFVREITDGRIKESLDLHSIGLTEGLIIPDLTKATAGLASLGSHGRLVCYHQPDSQVSMMFRSLRTRIGMLKNVKVICALSAERGDGKSLMLANLAISYAQQGARTLIIEGDLRRPHFSELFRYHRGRGGLTDILAMRHTLSESIVRDWIPGLDLLPAGGSSDFPSELLGGEKMRILMERLRGLYDIILIDTPALKGNVDGVVLAYQSDCLVFVVSDRKTKAASIVGALKDLEQIGRKPMVTLMNHAERDAKAWAINLRPKMQQIGIAAVPKRHADDIRKFEISLEEQGDAWTKAREKPQAS